MKNDDQQRIASPDAVVAEDFQSVLGRDDDRSHDYVDRLDL